MYKGDATAREMTCEIEVYCCGEKMATRCDNTTQPTFDPRSWKEGKKQKNLFIDPVVHSYMHYHTYIHASSILWLAFAGALHLDREMLRKCRSPNAEEAERSFPSFQSQLSVSWHYRNGKNEKKRSLP
jgi:hypothetical protein